MAAIGTLKHLKIKVTQKLKFVLGRVENGMGKGENDDFPQYFLLFCNIVFKRLFPSGHKNWGLW